MTAKQKTKMRARLTKAQTTYRNAVAERVSAIRAAHDAGMSYQEIADEMDTTKSTVWGIVTRND
jgi:DNA-binding NarL/FixJ family response regulator